MYTSVLYLYIHYIKYADCVTQCKFGECNTTIGECICPSGHTGKDCSLISKLGRVCTHVFTDLDLHGLPHLLQAEYQMCMCVCVCVCVRACVHACMHVCASLCSMYCACVGITILHYFYIEQTVYHSVHLEIATQPLESASVLLAIVELTAV